MVIHRHSYHSCLYCLNGWHVSTHFPSAGVVIAKSNDDWRQCTDEVDLTEGIRNERIISDHQAKHSLAKVLHSASLDQRIMPNASLDTLKGEPRQDKVTLHRCKVSCEAQTTAKRFVFISFTQSDAFSALWTFPKAWMNEDDQRSTNESQQNPNFEKFLENG